MQGADAVGEPLLAANLFFRTLLAYRDASRVSDRPAGVPRITKAGESHNNQESAFAVGQRRP